MSFQNVASWLQKNSSNSPELQAKVDFLSKLMESTERQKAEEQELWEEKMLLTMEIFDVQLEGKLLQDESAEQQKSDEEKRRFAEDLEQLDSLMQTFDLNKLVENAVLASQMRGLRELQQAKEAWESERPFYEQMEQRQIVQQLRGEEQKLLVEQNEIVEMKLQVTNEKENLCSQIKSAIVERNQCVVNFVKDSQETKQMAKEHSQRQKVKDELQKTLLRLQQQQQQTELSMKSFSFNSRKLTSPTIAVVNPQTTTPSAAPTTKRFFSSMPAQQTNADSFNFDSLNLLRLFQAFDAPIPKRPNFNDYLAEVQAKRQAERAEQLNSSLRSILSAPKTTADSQESAERSTTPTKHVTFLLDSPSHSSESSDTSLSALLSNESAKPNTNGSANADLMETEEIIVDSSQSQINKNDLSASAGSGLEIPSRDFKFYSDGEYEEIEVEEKSDAVVGPNAKKPKLEVLDCRIVKPAGTPLPKNVFDWDSSDRPSARTRHGFEVFFEQHINNLKNDEEDNTKEDEEENFNYFDEIHMPEFSGGNSDEMLELDVSSYEHKTTNNFL